nr:DUF2807 domain-containing protein [Saprospiraceae bacterium]
MKNLWGLFWSTGLIFLMVSGCTLNYETIRGNGDVVTEKRDLNTFSGVSIYGSFDVVVVPGEGHTIKIKAESNLLEHIVTEVESGSLDISTAQGYNLKPTQKIELEVSAAGLEHFEINGSGSIRAETVTTSLKCRILGSGNIELSGETEDAIYEIAGSGTVQTENLSTRRANVVITGSGSVYVQSLEELEVKITGSGKVFYKGSPAVKSSVTGSGSVERL